MEHRAGGIPMPWRRILPNLITCLALVCGISAIRYAIDSEFGIAVAAIILAMFLDALDGRVARALDGASKFGAEMDSLADLINFGIAPGVVVWLWSLHELGDAGWLAVVIFSVACCLRLARFNVSTSDAAQPAWAAKYFTGVNAPAGAALSLVPLYMGFAGLAPVGSGSAQYAAIYLTLIAGLMVSRIPTYSFKTFRPTSAQRLFLMMGFMILMPFLFLTPWHMLFAGSMIYLALIPFAICSYRRDLRRDEAGDDAASDTDFLPVS